MKAIFNSLQQSSKIFIVLGIIVLLNIFSSIYYTYFDLTEDKRFLLTESTKTLLNQVDNPIYVRILLDGDFPAGFKRLQKATIVNLWWRTQCKAQLKK